MAIFAALTVLALGTSALDRSDVCTTPRRLATVLCEAPLTRPAPQAALLRLRGGVREVEDRNDWDSIQAEAVAADSQTYRIRRWR